MWPDTLGANLLLTALASAWPSYFKRRYVAGAVPKAFLNVRPAAE
jgi:hypothetical protein